MLDGASYFRASTVQGLADRDDVEFRTRPSYSPELNPVEECWRQLEASLSDRYFDSLPALTTAIDALDQLSIAEMSNYSIRLVSYPEYYPVDRDCSTCRKRGSGTPSGRSEVSPGPHR